MCFVSEFFDEFNAVIPDMEAEFGENWSYNGSTFPAIAIEDLKLSRIVGAPGGPLAQATVSLQVRQAVFDSSGIDRGKIINVRGTDVRIMATANDGDAAVSVICGPVSAPMPSISVKI